MHAFDICAGGVALITVGIGIRRGFITELFRVIALLGGFVGAFLFFGALFEHLDFLKIPPAAKTVVAFLTLYLVTALALLGIGRFLKGIVHIAMLGWLDRLLGGCLGAAKAALILWLIVLSVSLFTASSAQKTLAKSATFRCLSKIPIRLYVPLMRNVPLPFRNIIDTAPLFTRARHHIDTVKKKVDSYKPRTVIDSSRLP